MKGAYDDLSQEHWDSACDNMPQEYVDEIVAKTLPPRTCIFDTFRPDYMPDVDTLAFYAREYAVNHPYEGAPDLWTTTRTEWCKEAFRKEDELRKAFGMPPREKRA